MKIVDYANNLSPPTQNALLSGFKQGGSFLKLQPSQE